jgi:hypothetical protein
VVTQRDLELLTFTADQYGLPMALAGDLLAVWSEVEPDTGLRLARRTAAKLEELRYARRVRVGDQTWLVPTGRGLALAAADGQEPYDLWRPTGWKLAHVEAVARLRLHLEQAHPLARWESERAIRQRWRAYHKQVGVDTRTRYADGGLHLPDGGAVGIELELHVKPLDAYEGIVHDQDSAWSEVWWYARPGSVATLRQRLDDALAVNHQVLALPDGIGL